MLTHVYFETGKSDIALNTISPSSPTGNALVIPYRHNAQYRNLRTLLGEIYTTYLYHGWTYNLRYCTYV